MNYKIIIIIFINLSIIIKFIETAHDKILQFYPYKPVSVLPEEYCDEDSLQAFTLCRIRASQYWGTEIEDYVCIIFFIQMILIKKNFIITNFFLIVYNIKRILLFCIWTISL